MKMNILKEVINWPKLKQELLPIICLSLFQVWLTFHFPTYIRLGRPLSTIIPIFLSGISIITYIIVFSLANNCISYLNLESFDYLPGAQFYAEIFKWLTKVSIITIAFIAMFFYWYIDFYRMPDLYYAVFYAHIIVTFVLWHRAVYRRP